MVSVGMGTGAGIEGILTMNSFSEQVNWYRWRK